MERKEEMEEANRAGRPYLKSDDQHRKRDERSYGKFSDSDKFHIFF